MVTDAGGGRGPEPARGPIAAVIGWCARNPALTLALTLALGIWGYQALRRVPLDALPDLSETQVLVAATWSGRSPDLIERQVTLPLTAALASTPRVERVRGQSSPGQALISLVFADGTDPYWARSRVQEALASPAARLPAEATVALGPDAAPAAWVLQYALRDRSGHHDLAELRALQDFHIRQAVGMVEGVAEVAAIGGALKQYQVTIDPQRLQRHRLTLAQVAEAVRRANHDASGRVIETAGHEQVIRGHGSLTSTADLEGVFLAMGKDDVPVLLRDVARVGVGRDRARGIAELDGEGETVGGVVVMRFEQNALAVIARVKERFDEVRRTLPEGVELVVTYDRSELIGSAIASLRGILIEEMVVVALVIMLFVFHARSALIPVLILPIATLAAFIPMLQQRLAADIMSLSGIAVAVGVMVDAAIIMIDNLHCRLARRDRQEQVGAEAVVASLQEVGPTIFFALLVIAVSFLPVLTLGGAEGRLFRPLAWTKTYAIAWSALLAVTAVPALAVLLVRGRLRGEADNPLLRAAAALYLPVARLAVRKPRTVLAAALVVLAASLPVLWTLDREFMPPLNEGTILYMPSSPPGISVTEATRILQQMDRELRAIPEVASVFGKMGAAETATDPAPLNMAETVVMLKPRDRWRPGLTWDGLLTEMDARMRYPGMPNLWWMPIQTRTEMLATGVRGPLGLVLHGATPAQLERTAIAIEHALRGDPRTAAATRGIFAERRAEGFYCDIAIRREAAARYGMNADDVNLVVASALGGADLGEVIAGRERFAIGLRYDRSYREDPESLARLPVSTPSGALVPLGEVATIAFATGPLDLASEGGEPVALIDVDVAGIGIPSYVALADQVIAARVALGDHVRVEWSGQYRHYLSSAARLAMIVPLTLLIIVAVIYLGTGGWIPTAMVVSTVPFSLIGAAWLLWLLDYKLSVAVATGLIALAGLDAETGVVMLLYLRLGWDAAERAGRLRTAAQREEAILDGAARRLRPKLMTSLCLLIGLLPALWSDGAGADVMKRIAAPMVGGIVTSFLFELTIYPALFAWWKGPPTASPSVAGAPASTVDNRADPGL